MAVTQWGQQVAGRRRAGKVGGGLYQFFLRDYGSLCPVCRQVGLFPIDAVEAVDGACGALAAGQVDAAGGIGLDVYRAVVQGDFGDVVQAGGGAQLHVFYGDEEVCL